MNLTLGMRILLHLSACDPGRDGLDLSGELTQQGIADALCVRQSDVSRALSRLKADGHVEEKSSTVAPGRGGRKQRLKVYTLSGKGRGTALALSSRMLDSEVTIPSRADGEEARRMRLKEVNSYLGTSYPPLRLADMVAPDGSLLLAPPAPPVSREPAAAAPEPYFVDREEELRRLSEKVREGPEALLSVVGIPGVGKTALARKLMSELGDRRAFYFPVREWPSYGSFLRSLRDFLSRHGRKRLAGLLGRAGSLPTEEAAGAVHRDLEGLGALLVLDDFHHAADQPELRHFVRRLLELLAPPQPVARILLLSCTSPGLCDRRAVSLEGRGWELQLGGLDERGARELAARIGMPEAALGDVYRATHGHPLSIRLLRGVPGLPVRSADASRFIQEDVIGGIPAGERDLLQILSVLRRPEDQETLLALSDDPLAFDALRALVSRSLVSDSDEKYGAHELVREGAYGRLPPQARRAYHLRAAALYLKGGNADGGVEAVYHFCRAGDFERAVQLLLSLGGELIAEGRLEECRSLLDLVAPGTPSETAGLRRLREDLLAEYGEWDLGIEYLHQCAGLAPAADVVLDNPGRRIRAEEEWRAALADHERGLRVLGKVGDEAGQCELLSSLGWIRLMRGEQAEAASAYRSIERFRGKSACREASLKAKIGMAHLAWLKGDRAGAARLFRQVLGRLGPAETDLAIACLNFQSLLAGTDKELGAALGTLGAALARCGAGRHRRGRAYTLLHVGQVRSRLGDRDGAAEALDAALAEFRGIGDRHGTVYALLALALDALTAKEYPAARRWAGEALREPELDQLAQIRDCAIGLAAAAAKPGAAAAGADRGKSGGTLG